MTPQLSVNPPEMGTQTPQTATKEAQSQIENNKTSLQVANFGAGPAKLPPSVLSHLRNDILNWHNLGIGIMEVSHRTKEFTALMKDTEWSLRRLVKIPDDYAVLFMQGGGTLQFAAVVMNLLRKDPKKKFVDYLVSGSWSEKAHQEAVKLLENQKEYQAKAIPIFTERDEAGEVDFIPPHDWPVSLDEAQYVYYCDNETIDGIEMPTSDYIPDVLASLGNAAPIVVDMSSNFLSRPIDVSKFGVIWATAQKNFGPAGLAVVIVKKALIAPSGFPRLLPLPTMMDYGIFEQHSSLYNTPPTISILTCNLVFQWLQSEFGGCLRQVEACNKTKAALLYETIAKSDGFYRTVVAPEFRSKMNVVFRIHDPHTGAISDVLENRFLKAAEEARLMQLKGHRSVGGIRVSIYNSVTLEEVQRVATLMDSFVASK